MLLYKKTNYKRHSDETVGVFLFPADAFHLPAHRYLVPSKGRVQTSEVLKTSEVFLRGIMSARRVGGATLTSFSSG